MKLRTRSKSLSDYKQTVYTVDHPFKKEQLFIKSSTTKVKTTKVKTSTKQQKQRTMSQIKEAFEEIEKFYGNEKENIEKWLQKVDVICACFDDITDEDKLKRIPTKLGPNVFDWFNENKINMGDWEDFKQQITIQYPVILTKLHPLVLVDDFHKRIKRDDETVTQYYHDKMALATKVDPQMIDVLRVSSLIDGLPSSFRQQFAYKRTEMTTPAKFLTVVQALEQEIELLSRATLEDQMSNLSIKRQYPNEDRHMEQLVTSISNSGQKHQKYQPGYQQFNTNNMIHHQRTPNKHQGGEEKMFQPKFENYSQHNSYNQTPSHPQQIDTQGQRIQYGQDNGQHTQANKWSDVNDNDRRCFNCGKFGHWARFCYSRRLKE
jgi:hypothetical protein